ncbi:hypothetical protein A2634_03185 [Candidatus Amesbacteria bacterium RIFCSPHIGHO2_01_FULL_48_32]|uniref:Dockerin domain-containing protein n=1 Tax=Candidatus Amesbacteria bacterium RIFCSPLOWO2_01_FULL_48_25 TaxID=1797259 RepID=A0A1F4ZCZ9_9BACT|nr:MAG: hypothetical protein A2634_03185 [Candidatus Amesbacteria bacterium RIFCSPHIGHO2_01_FULL_48_32]OGD03587.1 MAG: hypothetical protein A2989_02805 [Candidatus Amesbacteria bacterium RIFCSPLOWO2_01_FULL_48_25]HJZ04687.1 dockerin type I domain-containing protein [Patescibacteria group bacterium]
MRDKKVVAGVGLAVLVFGVAVGVSLVQQRLDIRKKAAGGAASYLKLEKTFTVNPAVGTLFDVYVTLNTDGVAVGAVDAVVNFSRGALELVDVIVTPRTGNAGGELRAFLPVTGTTTKTFDKVKVVAQANTTGGIVLGAVAQDLNTGAVLSGFNGSLGTGNPLAVLRFKGLTGGTTSLNWQYSTGATNDTNMVSVSSPTDILASVAGLSVTVASSVTGTPVPPPTGAFLVGDINRDGCVNVQDYILLSNAYGTNNSAADLNGDGIVNVQDYILLSNNFGRCS